MAEVNDTFIAESSTLREAMACIEKNLYKLAIIVDRQERFISAITDGDIRRAILRGANLDDPIINVKDISDLNSKNGSVVAEAGASNQHIQDLFSATKVRQIPVLDSDGRILRIELPNRGGVLEIEGFDACVMAGGLGERLRPLTLKTPKPMLRIRGKPLLETTVERLRDCGIINIWLSINYKREIIRDYFGDGGLLNVNIRYVEEDFPMGTAGSLSLIDTQNDLVVINGDVVTNVDFGSLANHHTLLGNDLTVGARLHDYSVPYGVLEMDGDRIIGVTEKPSYRHYVNAGIYVVTPAALKLIPKNRTYDMTYLIHRLISMGYVVGSFPIYEYWSDIGMPDEYEKAKSE